MGVGKTTFEFSNSSIAIDGGSTNINLTRDNQSYTNKLSHGYGDIYTYPAGVTDYTWSPTASQLTKFFEEIPTQKTRLIDVYLDTYNGSTKVGRDIHALNVTLSETTGKPSISGFSITDSNSTTKSWGIIVYGESTLTATATPTAKYGATISKNIFTCTYNNVTYESYYINDLISSLPLTTTPTSFTIGYKSTDSRGFSNTVTLSKTIAKYQVPHIDTFEVIRCDTSGNENENGTKAKVIIKGSWDAMKVGTTYKNTATLKVGYKTKTATSYNYQTISVSAGTVDISQLLSATLTADTDYEFSVQLTDNFNSYIKTEVRASNVNNILYISADGKELVIGSDTGNNVLIDSDSVDIRNGSKVLGTFTGTSTILNEGHLTLSSGADGNYTVGKIITQDPARLNIISESEDDKTILKIWSGQFIAANKYISSSDETDNVNATIMVGDSLSSTDSSKSYYHNGYIDLNVIHNDSEGTPAYLEREARIAMNTNKNVGSSISISAKTIKFHVRDDISVYDERYNTNKKISLEGHTHSASDITSGTLPVARGGTGATNASTARTNLGCAATSHNHSASQITSGTLPVARGGTGKTTGTFYGETVLYNNSTGTTGQVTLSTAVSNFTYIEIFYYYGNKYNTKYSTCHGSKKILPKQGYYFFLTESFYANDSVMQLLSEACCLWSTSIARGTPGVYINGNYNASSISSGKNSGVSFYITRVVGLK